jgi:hypothetical protein
MAIEAGDDEHGGSRQVHRFDERGAYLASIQLGFQGPPLDRARLAAYGLTFRYHRPRWSVPERWKAAITLLPAPPSRGRWFADGEAWTLGPDHGHSLWDLRLALAPDDEPPEDMRALALPGVFPDNLLALMQQVGLDGEVELHANAQYVVRRDRLPGAAAARAPWLTSTDPKERLGWSCWDVTGAPGLRQVGLRGIHGDDAVVASAHVTLRAPLSRALADEIDRAAWPRLSSFLADAEPQVVAVRAADELRH